jgi:hypothetical protein
VRVPCTGTDLSGTGTIIKVLFFSTLYVSQKGVF